MGRDHLLAARLVFLVAAWAGFLACSPSVPTPEAKAVQTEGRISKALESRAAAVAQVLASRDFEALASFVHPEKGLRFSPYLSMRESDRLVAMKMVSRLFDDRASYHWGMADASGLSLSMSFADYFSRFVWDRDFLHAPQVTVNRRAGLGTGLDNTRVFYPDGEFVEYHFPPTQEGALDWASLRLVFVKFHGAYFLVAIAHDGWTI